MVEVMINEDLQEKLSALIQEMVLEEGKSGEDLNFFHDNNVDKKTKKNKEYHHKTIQHY